MRVYITTRRNATLMSILAVVLAISCRARQNKNVERFIETKMGRDLNELQSNSVQEVLDMRIQSLLFTDSPSFEPTAPSTFPTFSNSIVPTNFAPTLSTSRLPTSVADNLTPPSWKPTTVTPSLKPTFSSTDPAESTSPTKSPSGAPSVKPTSLVPSVASTIFPTGASLITISYTVNQIISGVTCQEFDTEPARTAFSATVAETLNSSPTAVRIISVICNNRRRRRLDTTSDPSVAVNYGVQYETVKSVEEDRSILTNSVTSGAFTKALHVNAASTGATALLSASSTTVLVTSTSVPTSASSSAPSTLPTFTISTVSSAPSTLPTFTSSTVSETKKSDNKREALSPGAVAGICIAAIFTAGILCALSYYYLTRFGEKGDHAKIYAKRDEEGEAGYYEIRGRRDVAEQERNLLH